MIEKKAVQHRPTTAKVGQDSTPTDDQASHPPSLPPKPSNDESSLSSPLTPPPIHGPSSFAGASTSFDLPDVDDQFNDNVGENENGGSESDHDNDLATEDEGEVSVEHGANADFDVTYVKPVYNTRLSVSDSLKSNTGSYCNKFKTLPRKKKKKKDKDKDKKDEQDKR